ncbi:MAG: hypothetical protein IBX68_05135 [Dehalococcoidia bacterium]|nr:hypothetical protein [Dehalococcoidia bacterium]
MDVKRVNEEKTGGRRRSDPPDWRHNVTEASRSNPKQDLLREASSVSGPDSGEEKDKRESVQRQLWTVEQSFRNVIIRSANGILIADRNGVVRFVNPAGLALLGRIMVVPRPGVELIVTFPPSRLARSRMPLKSRHWSTCLITRFLHRNQRSYYS